MVHKRKRIAVWLLAAVLLVSLLPGTARAEREAPFVPVADGEGLISGQYVLLSSEGYAPGVLHSGWLSPVQPIFAGDTLTDPAGVLWQLEVTESGVVLRDPGGTPVSPGESDETGLVSGEYLWNVVCTDGRFSFHAMAGGVAVTLARVADLGFRAYDDRILQESYDTGFALYRMTGDVEEPEDPSNPTEDPSNPTEDPSNPTEEPCDPTEEPSNPTEEPCDPTEEPSNPTEEPSNPTEEPSNPTEEPCDPTEDPSDPTEDPSDPTEESSESLEDPEETEEDSVSQGPGLFFGLLHAHTADSDGTGTPAEAYAYASGTAELDFFAVTDHSNSFDGAQMGVLTEDASAVSQIWRLGREAALAATTDSFLALYGYEMTWQNGLGHISTFFTPGFQSRKQSEFSEPATGLERYYAALGTVPGSVSQFNHPGTFYGDFEDLGHYSEAADTVMQLLEVGCEGTYDFAIYTRALDKGWHVAPTISQNNHKGQWGDADPGRTVVYADALTEEAFASALGNRRVYATQDSDLEVLYRLNGNLFGSILQKQAVGDTVVLTAELYDPTDEAIGTVEVIVDGGAAADSLEVQESRKEVSFELPSSYHYYYLRITQPDGDMAVTAPVWINQRETAEITSFVADTALAVQKRPITLRVRVQNRDAADYAVEQIVFFVDGQKVGTVPEPAAIPGYSSAEYEASLIIMASGLTEIQATVSGKLSGEHIECTAELPLTFLTEDLVTTIVADGSHGTLPSLSGLETAAARHKMVLVQAQELTPELLASCDVLLLPAPDREYEEDYVNLIADYLRSGRTLILCGQADREAPEAAARLNRLLAALGLTARFRDDTAYDPVNNGGTPEDLFTTVYNETDAMVSGIRNPWHQTGGCTVDPGQGAWLVKGLPTTSSMDADKDGTAGQSAGEAVLLAREETALGGSVFYSGGMFPGNETLDPGGDAFWEEPNGNGLVLEALLEIPRDKLEISSIVQARTATDGGTLRIRGYVTVGTAVEGNRFPNMIYVQDDTGGLGVTDFTDTGLSVGTSVELIVQRQGDAFRLLYWETLEEAPYNCQPKALNCKDAGDHEQYADLLVKTEGRVVSRTLTPDGRGVLSFVLEDRDGDRVTVWVGDGIRSASTGENTLAEAVAEGGWVSAVGIVYRSDGQTVLRVRNCDEVVAVRETGKSYQVVKGAYSVWIRKNGKSLYMEVDGPGKELLGIEVDGERISQGNYQTIDGEYLTFRIWPRYLKTLELGSHSVVFKFRDGEARATLVVWNNADNPYTGDPIGLHLGLMLLSGGLLLKKRRRR